MANKYFGTDGIRDVANTGNLVPDRILRTAQSLGALLREPAPAERPRVGIGADTRISGGMIFSSLAAGFTSMGVDVVDFGVLPTPALAGLTRARSLGLGIMISASHNPMDDNGIKVFHRDGFKISDDMESKVERLMEEGRLAAGLPVGSGIGRLFSDPTGLDDYVAAMAGGFPPGMLSGLTIGIDCANGAAWKAGPEVLARLGARLHVMANAPNGTNINESCGSVHPEALRELVLAERCDAGVALDGDGDRSIFFDAAGAEVDGDAVMACMGGWLKRKRRLAGDTVVATVMSNIGLEAALRREGIRLERTPVGDRFVTDRLREGGFSLGGEQSGHIVFGGDNNYTGDGIYTSLRLFQVMVETGTSLADLTAGMERYPQILINVPVARKPPLEELAGMQARMRDARNALGSDGRVVVRYSGTENKLRVMIEGPRAGEVKSLAEAIADAVRADIGI